MAGDIDIETKLNSEIQNTSNFGEPPISDNRYEELELRLMLSLKENTKLLAELESEKHRCDVLSHELEALPDFISKFQYERSLLNKKYESLLDRLKQINLENSQLRQLLEGKGPEALCQPLHGALTTNFSSPLKFCSKLEKMFTNLELPFGPLDSQCSEIRAKTISWQANGIYISTPLCVMGKVEAEDVIQLCITVLYDLLVHYTLWAKTVIKSTALNLSALCVNINSPNEMLAGMAARDLVIISLYDLARISTFIFRFNDGLPEDNAQTLIKWIGSSLILAGERETRVLLATLLLEYLLRVESLRLKFFSFPEYIKQLVGPLLKSRNVQVQYQSIFALWLLSFSPRIAQELQQRFGIIPLLLEVAKSAIKEKIVRICISTWRNLLSQAPSIAVPVMIGAKVIDYLETLCNGKITDEEAYADVSILKDELFKAIQSLNSYDEYSSEVKSGQLDWSPPHKSELFWRDNASRLADYDCEILRQLVKLLDPTHNESKVVAIAAHDIGMYIECHTTGRKNIDYIGGKQKIMALITFNDPEVRFQALSTMQKYMKKLWNPT